MFIIWFQVNIFIFSLAERIYASFFREIEKKTHANLIFLFLLCLVSSSSHRTIYVTTKKKHTHTSQIMHQKIFFFFFLLQIYGMLLLLFRFLTLFLCFVYCPVARARFRSIFLHSVISAMLCAALIKH